MKVTTIFNKSLSSSIKVLKNKYQFELTDRLNWEFSKLLKNNINSITFEKMLNMIR